MGEIAEFPLPADVTAEERQTAEVEIARHTRVVEARERAIRFEGEHLGQTGPIWRIQYTRLYRVPNGYLVAAHDLREGIKVGFSKDAEQLAATFEHPGVRELIEDELRFRKVIGHVAHTE